MSQRERQKAASRSAIVESAAGLIRQKGPGGASVQAAMAGAGLTVGAFYAHFDDKASLVEEAFGTAMAEALELVRGAAGELAGVEAVQGVLDQYLSAGHRDDPAHGCPLPATLGQGAVTPDRASAAVVGTGVESMGHELVLRSGCSGQEAMALVALMVGGQVLARALRDLPLSDAVLDSCRQVGGRLVRAETSSTDSPAGRPAGVRVTASAGSGGRTTTIPDPDHDDLRTRTT